MLLRRTRSSVSDVLEHLVGMQAQIPTSPYVGLWSRLQNFRGEDLSRLIEERAAVRIALMRSTVHLVTARDCLALRPVLAGMLERQLYTGSPWGRGIDGMDIDALVAAGRDALADGPLTLAELGARLQERWPERDADSMAYSIRNLVPLVQVPPRGLWRASGRARCATAETWLDRPLHTEHLPDRTILRYLAAFGPASVADIRAWSGLTGLSDAIQRLKPGLRTFHSEEGTELLDLLDAPFPHSDTPPPPRFLPEYDNVLVAYARRERVIPPRHTTRVTRALGRATFLLDGFVAGWWSIATTRSAATLTIEPFEALGKQQRTELEEEGARLLDFVAGDRGSRDIQLVQPS